MDPTHKFGQDTAEGNVSEGSWGKAYERNPTGMAPRDHRSREVQPDTTFEAHYSIGDLAKQRRLGRETVRLLVKDEPGVLKIPSPFRGDSSCGHPRCRGTVAVTKFSTTASPTVTRSYYVRCGQLALSYSPCRNSVGLMVALHSE